MLRDQTVLVVEKEFLIALDIQRMIEAYAARQTIFARSAAEALAQRKSWGNLGLAVIEVRRHDDDGIALGQQLLQDKVPVVIITSDVAMRGGLAALASAPVLVKPISDQDLASAIETALAR